MIRSTLSNSRITADAGFRWRGHEVTRLEGFTDAVFAFAVTLLVVSLEVPKSYSELIEAMQGFPAFGTCFALLAVIWYEHYRYFRRYGLENSVAVMLNCALLFCVLLYVYPLKFIFVAMFNNSVYSEHQFRMLFTIFACGSCAVYTVFWLLYRYAWSCREELDLTALERLRTRRSMMNQSFMVVIGIASILIVQLMPSSTLRFAGVPYFTIPVYHVIAARIWRPREHRLRGGN